MALGKGLKALIPEEAPKNLRREDGKMVLEAAIDRVRPNPDQPRKTFNQEKLEELADSIKLHGIIQPIIVRSDNDGFIITAGERRWRAARMAGLTEVPVLVQDMSEDAVLEIAVIENIQREDLNVIEEARGYQTLIDRFGYTQAALAAKLGKNRTSVTNVLRILNLPESVQVNVINSMLSFGHARALLALPEEKDQLALMDKIIREDLSVRQTEQAIAAMKKVRVPKAPDMFAEDLGERLSRFLDTKVNVKNRKGKGKIEIQYASLEQLDQILAGLGIPGEDE